MRTDPRTLAGTRLDLLIAGGGIHGLFAAYDAALRGLSVALVERDDFGSGLSFNHQRTIHGGLRDLGAGRLAKARRQILERRRWVHMAPRLVRPLPFVTGTAGAFARSRWALGLGLRAYDALGRSTSAGVPEALRLPRSRLRAAAWAHEAGADLPPRGLTGVACWHDYQTPFPDRLNWLVAMAATSAGARLVNYAEIAGALVESGRVVGAKVRDRVTGETMDVPAQATLLAVGSQLGPVGALFGIAGAPPLVRAMNLLLARPAPRVAVASRGPSGRMLTLVPWLGRALVGTSQSAEAIDANEHVPPASAVAELLADVNATFPRLAVSRDDVALVQHGLVPAERRHGRLELKGEPEIVSFAPRGTPGLATLVGVKFTTARLAAERAIDLVCAERGDAARRSVTGLTQLPHAGLDDVAGTARAVVDAAGAALDAESLAALTEVYGTEAPAVLAFSAERGLLERLVPESPVLAGEIAYAAEHAAAVRLADVVQRRTVLGAAGHPGEHALVRAAEIMGTVRRWTPQERQEEIREAARRYVLPQV
ncbi:MAG: FAD-dependent oxidoreductase [Acidobacteria bacterium]|nr:FAD-dependent oxidoreductase [Acidobacteriota bacterium]